ncbi:AAA family ATPase [Bradyrhizobium yuanmingense]|uniref:ATP-dependent nuclease n=1 Tax=Bradyrhizobium yuanmingense TaxID=108015 RepID=UPI0023B8BFC8|nr:AAA family ATPase [Bradyrhizobium yuanmingense]MDF0522102.1 AAA family ATPase [Bradyrhizobium yuanmingense]
MKLIAFRITNFRSIVDTGWCPFASDGITVIVGQNESGKSSILEALATTLHATDISDDDCRIDAPMPAIFLRIEIDAKRLLAALAAYNEDQVAVAGVILEMREGELIVSFRWRYDAANAKYACVISCEDTDLAEALQKNAAPKVKDTESETAEEEEIESGEDAEEERAKKVVYDLTPERLGEEICALAPAIVLFDQAAGLLPDRVDIQKGKRGESVLSGTGMQAAANFLKIANINLDALVDGSPRTRQTLLARANATVTADFSSFWSQTIGKNEKLQLKCSFAYYGPGAQKSAGAPHLEFWITDGTNQLFPKQRSLGVRWFISFYLQLKASENDEQGTVFLFDEPGANLHSKAQADVLKVINGLAKSNKSQIVYSTHSPHMIEYDKLYRVIAAQRDGDADNSPTTLVHAHELGAASRDTLSPVLTAMGVDLSHQQVVKKRNNVILEEISGFYYLTAFWDLLGEKQEAYFIAATGASNVQALANMFLGWGLEFIVAVDDDSAGRQAYNNLKRYMFGDDEIVSKQRMLKIAGDGMEDIFSKNDFCLHILGDPDLTYEGKNSQHVKSSTHSKPILAYEFLNKVRGKKIKFADFDADTKAAIKQLVREITSRLHNKK